MSDDSLHSFPKVYAIGHSAVSDLFQDSVLVEEKVDGSQFSFGVVNGEIKMRSRGAKIFVDNPEGMFLAAVASVKELAPRLREGWTYRAEYLQKPKHNVLAYDRVPKFHLILFDINTGLETYLTRDQKEEEAERLGLEIVPKLFEGRIENPEDVYQLLNRNSILGEKKIEGIVVKNYSRSGIDKKVLMGKFVSEDFKETHNKEWTASNPTLNDIIERLIATLRNETRWEKAVFRLRDQGKLANEPKDIGLLMKEIQSDISAEEADFIAAKLLEFAKPRIIRASTSGFPEWYKKRLLESAFPTSTNDAIST